MADDAFAVTSDLGSVTELCDAKVDDRCDEMGEAHPALARSVAPERDASPIFQPREQVLDMVAPGSPKREAFAAEVVLFHVGGSAMPSLGGARTAQPSAANAARSRADT